MRLYTVYYISLTASDYGYIINLYIVASCWTIIDTRTILSKEYRSLNSSLRSFLHFPVTPSLLGPNIPLNTLFSNTLSLRSSFNVSDQVSHPCNTTGKIIVLYILIFKFLGSNRTLPKELKNNALLVNLKKTNFEPWISKNCALIPSLV